MKKQLMCGDIVILKTNLRLENVMATYLYYYAGQRRLSLGDLIPPFLFQKIRRKFNCFNQ